MSVGEAESMSMVAFCAVVVKSKIVAKSESGISPGPVAGVSSFAARPPRSKSRRSQAGIKRSRKGASKRKKRSLKKKSQKVPQSLKKSASKKSPKKEPKSLDENVPLDPNLKKIFTLQNPLFTVLGASGSTSNPSIVEEVNPSQLNLGLRRRMGRQPTSPVIDETSGETRGTTHQHTAIFSPNRRVTRAYRFRLINSGMGDCLDQGMVYVRERSPRNPNRRTPQLADVVAELYEELGENVEYH
ncbi:hypothetical protein CEXT_494441 [Caerostris extrusa]|uniref:Uncharacterized protein n=1 Tax=Caerostris extrusa TaxID=172846 RepID=A0AAV4RGW7_CAEEX|nr:hypothetical protein CEXT_494441 [Caerostris extrusa]